MELVSKIVKQALVKWKSLKWLQNSNLKDIPAEALNKLKHSLKENDFIQPFNVWQDNKGTIWILDGHHREKALKELELEGYSIPEELPANFVQCDNKKDAAKLVLVYSSIYARVSDQGLFDFLNDFELKLDELTSIDLPTIDLDKFEMKHFPKTDEEKLDEVPEALTETYAETGDIFLIDGKHRVMCGDSCNPADVALLMDGNKADMVFTDPPYGVAIGSKHKMLNSFDGGNRNGNEIKDDEIKPTDLFPILVKAFTNLKTVLQDCCSVFVTAPQNGELGMMMMMMMKESGLPIRHVLMWYKNVATFSMGRLDYDYQHEPILLTWAKSHKFYGKGEHKTSVWKIDKPRSSKEHPTMKPVELIINALLNNSAQNNIVTDIYLGSGSTLIAAEQTNRICYGMEIEPKYIDVILRRYKRTYPDAKFECLTRSFPFEELLNA